MRKPRLIFSIFILFSAVFAEVAEQGHDGVIYINTQQVPTDGKTTEVKFQLANPGRYSLQLVHTPEDAGKELIATATINAEKAGGKLERKYWIEDGIVSTFAEPLELANPGEYTVSISCAKAPQWIRVVPTIYEQSRIMVGSKARHDQWVKMAQSPQKKKAMEWYQEAKFGMFVHWGVYSLAAGSWKDVKIEDSEHNGPKVAEWLMFTFQIPRAEYKEYAKQFNPDASFADAFATLAQKTGMKYMVITSKHHDGFALFDSEHSQWDIGESSPYNGDLILELYEACQKVGVEFGVYYSHGHDWMDGADANYTKIKNVRDEYNVPTRPNGKNLWDPSNDVYEEYLEKKSYAQVKELVKKMPKLKLIWFDGDGLITEKQAFRFYKMVYDLNPNIVINRRVGYEYGDYMDAGDNRTPKAGELTPKYFETCGTANHSWGFKAHDHEWKTTPQLLRNFVDIISKGGNYLLNIGPDGKGKVPEPCAKNFVEMGEWIKNHGDAIYGTERWITFSEGVDPSKKAKNKQGEFWFSAKENKVYAMTLTAAPEKVTINSFGEKVAGKISKLRLLNGPELTEWEQTEEGVTIDFSGIKTKPSGYALEVSLK